MAITIETPKSEDHLTEFVLFHDEVYRGHGARWRSVVPLELPILKGDSPFNHRRRMRPFLARENGKTVARVAAVIDERYQEHWNDPTLAHTLMFEALPGTREAV